MKTILKYTFAIILITIASILLLGHGIIFCINYPLLKGTSWVLRNKPPEALTTSMALICYIPKVLTDLFSNLSNYLYVVARKMITREEW